MKSAPTHEIIRWRIYVVYHSQGLNITSVMTELRISFPRFLGFSQSAMALSGRITGIRSWIKAIDDAAARVRMEKTGVPFSMR